MLYHAKNGTLKIGNDTMDYIRFGNGKRVLLILPGLGDGLQTVMGTALPMRLCIGCLPRISLFMRSAAEINCHLAILPVIWPVIRRKPWTFWESIGRMFLVFPWAV